VQTRSWPRWTASGGGRFTNQHPCRDQPDGRLVPLSPRPTDLKADVASGNVRRSTLTVILLRQAGRRRRRSWSNLGNAVELVQSFNRLRPIATFGSQKL